MWVTVAKPVTVLTMLSIPVLTDMTVTDGIAWYFRLWLRAVLSRIIAVSRSKRNGLPLTNTFRAKINARKRRQIEKAVDFKRLNPFIKKACVTQAEIVTRENPVVSMR